MSPKEANERRVAAMQDDDLLDLMKRTTAFAARLIRQHRWRGSADGVLPRGMSAEDVAHMALEKVLAGAKWDEDKPLPLVMEGLVRGWVGNLANRAENRSSVNADDTQSPDGEEGWVSAIDGFECPEPSPEAKISRKEDDNLILDLIASMEEGSPERKIAEAIFGGASKRAEIFAEAGLKASEYEAAKKRLRRALENFRQERASAHH